MPLYVKQRRERRKKILDLTLLDCWATTKREMRELFRTLDEQGYGVMGYRSRLEDALKYVGRAEDAIKAVERHD